MTSVVLNGNTYSDDADPDTGLANGGHRTRFIPALSDALAELAAAVASGNADAAAALASEIEAAASAAAAAASAATAVLAPGTAATSATSLTIGTGTKSLTVQSGKLFVVGMSCKIARSEDGTVWMAGDVTAYDSGSGALEVAVGVTQGAGTHAAWTVSLAGAPGVTGWAGITNKPTTIAGFGLTDAEPLRLPWSVKTAAYTAVAGDRLECDTRGGSFAVTLPAAAAGARVVVSDYAGSWGELPLTVLPDGSDVIEGESSLICDRSHVTVILEVIDATQGWGVS